MTDEGIETETRPAHELYAYVAMVVTLSEMATWPLLSGAVAQDAHPEPTSIASNVKRWARP